MANKVQTQANGQIVRDEKKDAQAPNLVQLVTARQKDFGLVLPKHITAERMVRLAVSALRTNPDLAKCSVPSFMSSLMACSALGLEPNTPLQLAFLIPRWSSKLGGQECTLLIGYQGLKELMYRSGFVSSVMAEPVFEGDTFEYEKGLHPKLVHRPCGEDDPAKLTHVYTIVRWKDGGEPIWDVLTRRQVLARRDMGGYKKSRQSPWDSHFVEMSKKSGVRAIAKWAPTATEKPTQVAQALAYEDAAERGRLSEAVRALPEVAQDSLADMGALPPAEDPDGPDGVSVPTEGEVVPERDPGQEG